MGKEVEVILLDGPMHGKTVVICQNQNIQIPYRMKFGERFLTVDLLYVLRPDYYAVAEFDGVFVDRNELHNKGVYESAKLKWLDAQYKGETTWDENELKELSKKSN